VYGDRITQQGIEVAQRLSERAAAKGCSLPQLAVAWVLHQPGITGTIVGPRTLDHFKDLLGASNVSLDASDLEFCDALVPAGSHVSDHFNSAGWRKGG
jgi:aryl-alcohol dehydrogenase-like predicted oxidoreductase